MHTKFRMALILVLALASVGAAFAVGYFRGFTTAKHDDTVVGLQTYLSLYRFEQQGDTNRLADRTRFMIFGYANYYDAHFSGEPVPYSSFLQDLAEARIIASQESTNVVRISDR